MFASTWHKLMSLLINMLILYIISDTYFIDIKLYNVYNIERYRF